MQKERNVKEDGSFKEVSTDQQNSIEISVNAKKEMTWKVKVYEDDPVKCADKLADFLKIANATHQSWEDSKK